MTAHIRVYFNNLRSQDIDVDDLSVGDAVTFARQISECSLVARTRVTYNEGSGTKAVTFENGEKT